MISYCVNIFNIVSILDMGTQSLAACCELWSQESSQTWEEARQAVGRIASSSEKKAVPGRGREGQEGRQGWNVCLCWGDGGKSRARSQLDEEQRLGVVENRLDRPKF